MTERLSLEPLTQAAFGPYGAVVEAAGAATVLANGGTSQRFHALASADVAAAGGRPIISITHVAPRPFPYTVAMMERHPLGSQMFFPLHGRPWLVLVADDDAGRPGRLRAFLAGGDQGVQYARNVWHHPMIAVWEAAAFLIVDREGPGDNLEIVACANPATIAAPPGFGMGGAGVSA